MTKNYSMRYQMKECYIAFNIEINNKLVDFQIHSATVLKDKNGINLKGKYSEVEGLAIEKGRNEIKGDSKLIISFENSPRIIRYTTFGNLISRVKLPKKTSKKKSFRNKNKALENVTTHPNMEFLQQLNYR